MKYLLDTCVWIWWNINPPRLTPGVLDLLGTPNRYEELLLSAISPWEFCKLLEKGRLGVNANPPDWIMEALEMPKLRLHPITPGISYSSTTLPPPFHDDPADRIIVATARACQAMVITPDDRIRGYPHVRTLW